MHYALLISTWICIFLISRSGNFRKTEISLKKGFTVDFHSTAPPLIIIFSYNGQSSDISMDFSTSRYRIFLVNMMCHRANGKLYHLSLESSIWLYRKIHHNHKLADVDEATKCFSAEVISKRFSFIHPISAHCGRKNLSSRIEILNVNRPSNTITSAAGEASSRR